MPIRIHELPADPGAKQKKRRVGRGEGSGTGKTAGKGTKGQQARAGSGPGAQFEGGQMPLVMRIPKFGFSNERFRTPSAAVTLRQLNKFEDGSTIDLEALHKAGLVTKKIKRVKLICKGKLERKLTLRLHGFSAGAKAAVEAAGGTAEVVS